METNLLQIVMPNLACGASHRSCSKTELHLVCAASDALQESVEEAALSWNDPAGHDGIAGCCSLTISCNTCPNLEGNQMY